MESEPTGAFTISRTSKGRYPQVVDIAVYHAEAKRKHLDILHRLDCLYGYLGLAWRAEYSSGYYLPYPCKSLLFAQVLGGEEGSI